MYAAGSRHVTDDTMLALFIETHKVFAPVGILFDDEASRQVDFTVIDGTTSIQMPARCFFMKPT